MGWKFEVSDSARRQLKKLDPQVSRRILRFLYERVARLDNPRGIGEALRGRLGEYWKYRVGDYRLIARMEDERLIVLIVEVDHRSQVYEGF